MTKSEEWDEFLNNMISVGIDNYKKTTEYNYIKKQRKHIDDILRDNLTVDQKTMVEECIFELCVAKECESEMLYKQGMTDCVFILKCLGILV